MHTFTFDAFDGDNNQDVVVDVDEGEDKDDRWVNPKACQQLQCLKLASKSNLLTRHTWRTSVKLFFLFSVFFTFPFFFFDVMLPFACLVLIW